jgi:hypothetical protein
VFAALLLLVATDAWCYRPFVGTDADVARLHDLEVETGLIGLSRDSGHNVYTIPNPLVLNYGLVRHVEVVGQFAVIAPDGQASQLSDPELAVKVVLKEGELQDQPGVSVALESSLLFSSTLPEENRIGFEEAFMFSRKLLGLTFHLNLGGGVERSASLPFAAYGLITEFPLSKRLRFVDEINGESINTRTPDTSDLAGFLWEPYWNDVVIDAAYRRGLSAVSQTWSVQAGISIAFSLGKKGEVVPPENAH